MDKFPRQEIENLLKRIRNGDGTAFSQLADLKSKNLHNLAYSYLHDEMLAEDVVQEVFYELMKKCKRFKNDENLNGWLNTVAINKSLNILKKRKREVFIEDSPRQDSIHNELEVEQMHIRECLSMLDENERQVLELRHHGYTVKEMTEIIGLTTKQLRDLIERAKNKFKEFYDK